MDNTKTYLLRPEDGFAAVTADGGVFIRGSGSNEERVEIAWPTDIV